MRIITAQERAKLKPGTIAVDDQGNAWKLGTGSWVSTGSDTGPLYDDMDHPMTILLEGGKSAQPELNRLRGERRDLLKKLESFDREGHSTVGIAFLRRQLGSVA